MSAHAQKRIEKRRITCTGPLPKELGNLTNLEELDLRGNKALNTLLKTAAKKYASKAEVAVFLRGLGKKSQACSVQ